jgi:hypothetical protein
MCSVISGPLTSYTAHEVPNEFYILKTGLFRSPFATTSFRNLWIIILKEKWVSWSQGLQSPLLCGAGLPTRLQYLVALRKGNTQQREQNILNCKQEQFMVHILHLMDRDGIFRIGSLYHFLKCIQNKYSMNIPNELASTWIRTKEEISLKVDALRTQVRRFINSSSWLVRCSWEADNRC